MTLSYKNSQIGVCFFYFLYHKVPLLQTFFLQNTNSIHPHHSDSSFHPHFKQPAAHPVLPCSRGESAAQQLDMSCTAKQKETSGKQRKATCILTFSEQKKHSFNLNDLGFQPFFCFLKNSYNFFAPYTDFL